MQLRQLLLALAALSLVQHCFLGPRQNEAPRARLVLRRAAPPVELASEFLAGWERQEMAQKKAGAAPAGLTPPKEISEAEELRSAIQTLAKSKSMQSLRLGIMAPSGEAALTAMQNWVEGLELDSPADGVMAVDDENSPLDMSEIASGPVYLKYQYSFGDPANRADNGNPSKENVVPKVGAYMKSCPFPGRGWIGWRACWDHRVSIRSRQSYHVFRQSGLEIGLT
ncbi:unnamed protein product [Symbiodinium necroappetens]|uniref:Uncharacterized protein n=1 Tax=Symbiodinium necroappetens TaxID=1628268 RepID=A0A812M0I0_9DINO|nr:unnamed protein product [Symbiodinium necroappetens]